MKKIKIKNPRRFRTILLIVALILYVALALNIHEARKVKYETITHTVVAGDTLWNLAKQNINNEVNIQEYIYNIEQMNNCTADLQIGQQLMLLKVVE